MANKPLLIGVTGGIGSGKSTVCKIFEVLDHQVYYADNRAKWLMNNDPSLQKEIVKLFGENSYTDGNLNRKLIAEQAFKNPNVLNELNDLVHPAVADDLRRWVLDQRDENLLFDEAALLFETGSYKKMDANLLVTAKEEVRISRVLKRDPHRTEESVKQIISQQMMDKDKIPLADYVIQNDGNQSILKQTMALYEELLSRHK